MNWDSASCKCVERPQVPSCIHFRGIRRRIHSEQSTSPSSRNRIRVACPMQAVR